MKRIVILISGRGSNMRSIVQACKAETWPAQVVAVIANRADAGGLRYAHDHGIATQVVEHKAQPSREAFDAALMQAIDAHRPDVVALAGFMRILGAAFVRHYEGRLINIHPSLLPAFAGLHTHQRAIDVGCKVAGATVHFVTAELDHGPIVAQAVVPVLANDTADTLADRVLMREHEMYPRALRWFVQGRLALSGGTVRQLDGESQLF
jgi:phosphoribosylglycinamide formyltransferase 1